MQVAAGAAAAPRHRSTSEAVAPWDAHDGGGLATYLPAIPAPRSPAPRRSIGGINTPGAAANKHAHTMAEPLLAGEDSEGKRYGGSNAASLSSSSSDDPADIVLDNGGDDGTNDEADPEDGALPGYVPPPVSHAHKLGQWMATGICGNDITSSCLYVTGLCVADAGIYAPICLAMVAFTLYLFRKIYGEAVTALPLNGGAYNVLLNVSGNTTHDTARASERASVERRGHCAFGPLLQPHPFSFV